ncbi:MAG TPA: hypothetical protein VFY26_14775, partial [Anaerolineales bacterium]|nr:hypothetical protein [Anaerolineales bacterium]
YFLKSAKIFGENIENVRQIFEKHGYRNFRFDEQHGLLEFHVSRIKLLTKLDIEVGISTNVIELRNGQPVLRELKVDVTTPQSFRLSKDI